MAGDTSTATETRLGKYQVLQRDYDPTECWAVVAVLPYRENVILMVYARKQEAERQRDACNRWCWDMTPDGWNMATDEQLAKHPLLALLAEDHPAHNLEEGQFRDMRYEVERLPFRW